VAPWFATEMTIDADVLSPHSASLEALRGGTELLQRVDRSLPSSGGDRGVAELRKPEGGPRLSAYLCRREACGAVLEPHSKQEHTEPREPKLLRGSNEKLCLGKPERIAG
jgi:hypothetical protein